jgi:hypothetical protein
MAAPEDSAEVLSALRLGWYLAEVRGRNRPGGPVPPAESLPNRLGHTLPLRSERTPEELRIEAQAVVRKLASDPQWRDGAQDILYRQLRRWYELLILGQDPSTLIKPYTVFTDRHASMRAIRALWVQFVTVAVSLALVIALVTLIINGSSNAFLKALFGVLGVAGLSAATVQAGLKNTAQGLVTRFRQDAYTDLVAAAIAEAPGKPGARRQDAVITGEIRKRTLTTTADAAVP